MALKTMCVFAKQEMKDCLTAVPSISVVSVFKNFTLGIPLALSLMCAFALIESPAVHAGEYVGERNSFNRFHGEGTYTSRRGLIYEGHWVDGRKNGKGKQTWPNGDVYEGEWFDNKRHGKGVQTWANGDQYDGEWVGGKRTGKGTYSFANGNVYTGSFRNNKRKGEGEIAYKNGSRFRGSWDKDERHGKGLIIYSDGSVLEGNWNNGKFSGSGTFATKKYKYVGTIKSGRPHGKGTCITGSKKESCEFANGKRVVAKAPPPKPPAPKPAPKPEPKVVAKPEPKPSAEPAAAAPKAAATAVATATAVVPTPAKPAVAPEVKAPEPVPTPAPAPQAAEPAKPYSSDTPEFLFSHNWYVGGEYKNPSSSWFAKNARREGDIRIRTENEKYLVTITINEYNGPGEYELRYFGGAASEKGVASYATSSDQPGKVIITKDNGKMISGTFNMTVYRNGNISSGESKQITNGRFTVVPK